MADSSNLKSDAIMEQMNRHLATDEGKQVTSKIGLVYQIHIAPKKIGFDEVVYTVDLKKGEVTKGSYEGGKPDASFSFKDDDFVKVALGKMNPQIAFMRFNLSNFNGFFHSKIFIFLAVLLLWLCIDAPVSVVAMNGHRGAIKIKGSLSAAQKFTPDIFPKPSKL